MRVWFVLAAFLAAPVYAQDVSVAKRMEDVWKGWADEVGITVWSLSIGYNGKVVREVAQGLDPEDVRPLIGLSKPITAECVRRVLAENALPLDAPLSAVFGENLRELGLDQPENDDITMSSLITHSALDGMQEGYLADHIFAPDGPADTTAITLNVLSDTIRRRETPRHVFGNAGYVVLGQVIMTLTGQEYVEACRDRLFNGDQTYQIFPPIRAMEVTSGWETTPSKYLQFAFAQFGNGSDMAADPLSYPSIAVRGDEYYGMGTKFSVTPIGANFGHFSLLPLPDAAWGAFFNIYENGWGIVVTFDGAVPGILSIGLLEDLKAAAISP